MRTGWRNAFWLGALLAGVGLLWACPFDTTLRGYLDLRFWLPFTKDGNHFVRDNVQRASEPFAGMQSASSDTPLAKLRAAYQVIAMPEEFGHDTVSAKLALATARADSSLSAREREEVELLDAKIEMRAGSKADPEPLKSARQKLMVFLAKAQTPEYLSEARGWLARVHCLLGDQTAAGKIYIDELNRPGSNLSLETVLTSLRMVYGYDGGPELLAHLEDYFDTPEHAAFAIQLATNSRRERDGPVPPYAKVSALLEEHRDLLRSATGANALAILGMRAALHAGDPPAVVKLVARQSNYAT